MHTTDDNILRDGDVAPDGDARGATLDGAAEQDQTEDAAPAAMEDWNEDEEYEAEQDEPDGAPVRRRRGLLVVAAALGGVVLLAAGVAGGFALGRRGSDPVVATVNGEQIHRSEYDRAVAQNAGSQ